MLKLITSPEIIEQATGVNPVRDSLFGLVTIDAPMSGIAVLLKTADKGAYLIIRHSEGPNIGKVRNAKVLYYNPYFAFSNLARSHNMPKTWVDVITKYFLGDRDVKVYGDITFERYRLLSEKFEVTLDSAAEIWEPTFVYAADKSALLSAFAEDSEAFRVRAEQLCERLAQGDKIKAQLGKADNRFELLDQMLSEQSLETLVLSSPLNVQEVSSVGIYARNLPDMLGVYNRGEAKVYILSRQEYRDISFSYVAKFDNQQKALEAVTSGTDRIGIDGVHLPMQQFLGLGLARDRVIDASDILRLWRERRAGLAELSYHIVAVQAARYAIEGALDFAVKEISSGRLITELDVRDRIRALVSEFESQQRLPGWMTRYHEVVNAGEPYLCGGLPTDYVLTENIKALHIDSGVKVMDSGGRFRGVADLARIALFTEEGRQHNEFLIQLARKKFVPAAVPGLRGEDMFNKYIEWLEPHAARFRQIGVMPVKAEPKDITRDAGHGLGLQEPITLWFKTGNQVELRPGMVCTVEFKWVFDEMWLGVEDEFLVTEHGGVNITV
ncbi:MAG: M24 family metallopeptidase [Desulfobacteraceae bacterium]|nr:M24 family metallopeptidase [Desulfobacteraceae bacterium]